MNTEQFNIYIIPLLYLAGGIIIGYIFEKIVFKILHRITRKTSWKGDDVIFDSFQGMPFFWAIAGGAYFGINSSIIDEHYKDLYDKIIVAFFILSGAIFSARMVVGFIAMKTEDTPGAIPSTSIIANIIRAAFFLLGIMFVFQSFGISIAPMLTALGVGGLAVALALQDTLSNLFSGIQLIASGKVKTGNFIRISPTEEGYVTDITWRYTTIQTVFNNVIIIPNSKLATSIITNFNLPDQEVVVRVEVGVSYDSDLQKVEEIAIQVAKELMKEKEAEGGITSFEPVVRFHTFGESSVNFTVIFRVKEFINQSPFRHEFMKALHRKFKETGIEIPFPIRTVIMKNK